MTSKYDEFADFRGNVMAAIQNGWILLKRETGHGQTSIGVGIQVLRNIIVLHDQRFPPKPVEAKKQND